LKEQVLSPLRPRRPCFEVKSVYKYATQMKISPIQQVRGVTILRSNSKLKLKSLPEVLVCLIVEDDRRIDGLALVLP
jgi:hypothetical protein